MKYECLQSDTKEKASFETGNWWHLVVVCVLLLTSLIVLTRTTGAQTSAGHPEISGFWELRYDSFNIPQASLTPKAAAAKMSQQEENDRLAIRWCDQVGMPAIMADRQPLDVRQGPSEVAIVAHPPSSARYIYTDGRPHPSKDEYDPTTNGHSIGHWDGNTLVVDTVYFNDRGITRLPGGGIRTPDSHLTEHFRLLNNGKNLLVVFTWEDPKVFAKPHTYAYLYYRVADPELPRIDTCRADDKQRANFLLTVPQAGSNWPANLAQESSGGGNR